MKKTQKEVKTVKVNPSEYNDRKEFIKSEISGKIRRYFGKTVEQATKKEIYNAVSFTIRDEIMEKWIQ